ncbi:hypothetical protein J4460_07790 [Candidatus Woesearchaeota archaeon]|nr:MAG: hypothetical protein QS99_C0011G0037 [archaeon GW2011_AR4]MBS3130540.1 hypothetical protein [Candidatus Woesearchaeota archaeon]HIH38020.1 hypothetical protein [Candidatus Woesearchaeota archaeon]HIH48377.1 hypothetical protein [Candidatus Woesearchaeota archaeon]HIJ02989.1 hypothetical protein [Candidatus Woesearchaeota archaeon]
MKGLNKKSQITMFMVVGIILVVVIAFILYVNSKTVEQTLSSGVQEALANRQFSSAVETFTNECLGSALDRGILEFSIDGGGLLPTRDARTSDPISLYYRNDKGQVSSAFWTRTDEFDAQLQQDIANNFLRCIDNYQLFREYNTEVIAAGEPRITPVYTDIDTKAILEYPITIQDASGSHDYISFSAAAPYRFGAMKSAIMDILSLIDQMPGIVSSPQMRDAKLSPIANQYGFVVAFDDPKEDIVIISLADPHAAPFLYNFAVEVKKPSSSQAYTINAPSSITAIAGAAAVCVPIDVQFSFNPPSVFVDSFSPMPGTTNYRMPGDVRIAGNNDQLCYQMKFPGAYTVDIVARDYFTSSPYTTTRQRVTITVI